MTSSYPKRAVVTDEQMARVNLKRHFHRDWDYTIRPARVKIEWRAYCVTPP